MRRKRRLHTLPKIAEQLAKPLGNIEPIKINQVSGLGATEASGSATDQTMESLLNMAVKPISSVVSPWLDP